MTVERKRQGRKAIPNGTRMPINVAIVTITPKMTIRVNQSSAVLVTLDQQEKTSRSVSLAVHPITKAQHGGAFWPVYQRR